MNKSAYKEIAERSFGEIKEQQFAYAVLPWGAIEPHNYHLPYATDILLSRTLSIAAAEKTGKEHNIVGGVLPPVWLGSQNPGQWNQPFCIHARYETQKAILTDVVASLYRQQIKRLIIVNGHGGNAFKNMVRDLAFDYPDFIIAVTDWFLTVRIEDYFENGGGHADEMETSLLLHYFPQYVDMGRAGSGAYTPFAAQSLNEKTGWLPRDWSKVSDDTGVGNPFKASAEKGARYAAAVIEKLSQLFSEIAKGGIYRR